MSDTQETATSAILKWVATVAAMAIASSMVWATTLVVGDLRAFGTALARIEIAQANHQTEINRLYTRIERMETRLSR